MTRPPCESLRLWPDSAGMQDHKHFVFGYFALSALDCRSTCYSPTKTVCIHHAQYAIPSTRPKLGFSVTAFASNPKEHDSILYVLQIKSCRMIV